MHIRLIAFNEISAVNLRRRSSRHYKKTDWRSSRLSSKSEEYESG